jgi:oxygen-independent coproporphyrinogen-3 oxidase
MPLWRGLALSPDDRVRAAVISQLMCQGVIEVRAIEACFGIDFRAYFAESLARLQAPAADGLVAVADERITVTGTGRLLLRSIAMCFDAYLNAPAAAPAARPSFSRVV